MTVLNFALRVMTKPWYLKPLSEVMQSQNYDNVTFVQYTSMTTEILFSIISPFQCPKLSRILNNVHPFNQTVRISCTEYKQIITHLPE